MEIRHLKVAARQGDLSSSSSFGAFSSFSSGALSAGCSALRLARDDRVLRAAAADFEAPALVVVFGRGDEVSGGEDGGPLGIVPQLGASWRACHVYGTRR